MSLKFVLSPSFVDAKVRFLSVASIHWFLSPLSLSSFSAGIAYPISAMEFSVDFVSFELVLAW